MTVLGREQSGTHVSKARAAKRVAGLNEDAWEWWLTSPFAKW